ncbi:uncharacterized protein LOC107619242 isoform X1 [Arachis ipaensis]|uniref:uncharacterized protein LOC107619242 isoform X1 n=1 Tax=Arachis ipaensis TaxID=130454 RepID=UPI000A2AF77F|nr:uncharacterized protein LOC107619242 isoform X1 [Arachis ipaensis]
MDYGYAIMHYANTFIYFLFVEADCELTYFSYTPNHQYITQYTRSLGLNVWGLWRVSLTFSFNTSDPVSVSVCHFALHRKRETNMARLPSLLHPFWLYFNAIFSISFHSLLIIYYYNKNHQCRLHNCTLLSYLNPKHWLQIQPKQLLPKSHEGKKTLAELKEEETLLLKERRSLKNELASLRLTLEKHRATNESLKRLKLDLESQRNSEPTKICEESKKGVVDLPQCHPSTSLSPKTVTHKVIDGHSYVCPLNSRSKSQEMSKKESTLVLPDLNLPVDVDLSSNCMD